MSETGNPQPQVFEFKAEMKQLLNIIVHSLYTHPEIFLRELVSNASDALNKLRFKRLTDSNILDPELELKIIITIDKETNTFSIEDTGIGMTKDDLVNQIGTVASSGTLELAKSLQQSKQQLDGALIGKFGVGFYSVFMVTDEVTIDTRYAEAGSQSWRWRSSGASEFIIDESDRHSRGTKISFKLKDEHKEFCQDYKVKAVLNKYSNFVDFPLYIGDEIVNTVAAIWHRPKDQITLEELDEFYKFLTGDWEKPLGNLHFSVEGNVNFKALLFIPSKSPLALFRDVSEKSLHLYSSRVFIQDDAKELLPDYLKFVKGVVDTESLPLNISREITQTSPVMAKIKNVICGKLLTLLEDWAENDKPKYDTFFKNFGTLLKTGTNADYANKSRIVELLRFESSALKADETCSLKDYCSRMLPDQKEIYYLSGDHRHAIERNPNIEYFKSSGIEVLYLTDPVDIFTIPYLQKYNDKPLVSADKADVDITKVDESDKLSPEMAKSLISTFKETLGERVADVVESKRLVDSPATLVIGKDGFDHQMEKMMQMLGHQFTSSKRILEINTSHKLIKNLARRNMADSSDPILRDSIVQLYEAALLTEGYLKSPADFVSRLINFMTEATK